MKVTVSVICSSRRSAAACLCMCQTLGFINTSVPHRRQRDFTGSELFRKERMKCWKNGARARHTLGGARRGCCIKGVDLTVLSSLTFIVCCHPHVSVLHPGKSLAVHAYLYTHTLSITVLLSYCVTCLSFCCCTAAAGSASSLHLWLRSHSRPRQFNIFMMPEYNVILASEQIHYH